MYIISKFKDYYDGVAHNMGIDKKIVYIRETKEIKNINEFPQTFMKDRTKGFREHNPMRIISDYSFIKPDPKKKYSHFIVGFCGKLYPGWKLYTQTENSFETEIIYDLGKMKELIETKFKYFWGKGSLDENYDKIVKSDAMDIFRNLNTPAFVYDFDFQRIKFEIRYSGIKEMFTINPLLKDYNFFKVFDSYQAFQEISMFIGGVLGTNEKNIVEVEDKYKITQHGFDKWSFRKEPTKNK